MVLWVARLTRNGEGVGSGPIKAPPPPRCFLKQETLPYCLVLFGTKNGCERDFTIELNKLRALSKTLVSLI